MSLKGTGGKVGAVFVVCILIGMLYTYVGAGGIGFILGGGSVAGPGIRVGTGGDKDTIAVKPANWWFTFDANDSLLPDTTNMKTFFATHYALEESLNGYLTTASIQALVEDSLNSYWTSGTITAAIEDSLNGYLTTGTVQSTIHDTIDAHWAEFTGGSGAAIHDSMWYQDTWSPTNFSLDTVYDMGMEILYPLTILGTPSHLNVIRIMNNTGTDDYKVGFEWNGRYGGGYADPDSFTFGLVTTDTDTSVTKVNLSIYAMNDQSAWAPEDTAKFSTTSYASTVADTWRWISIAGASIDPIAPLSYVYIHCVCTLDDGEMVQIEGPDYMTFWAMRR